MIHKELEPCKHAGVSGKGGALPEVHVHTQNIVLWTKLSRSVASLNTKNWMAVMYSIGGTGKSTQKYGAFYLAFTQS